MSATSQSRRNSPHSNVSSRVFLQRISQRLRQRSFTIIELLIVLAVSSTVLAAVFYSVPQLLRNHRNDQRRYIAASIKSSLETYSINSDGKFPFLALPTLLAYPGYLPCSATGGSFSCYDWLNRYVSGGKIKITDPSTGQDTNISIGWDSSTAPPNFINSPTVGNSYIAVGAKCSGNKAIQPNGDPAGSPTSLKFAITIAMEPAGSFFCLDNS